MNMAGINFLLFKCKERNSKTSYLDFCCRGQVYNRTNSENG